ncbi:MAG: polymerase subunit sigma-24 [Verrucomicrobia bacterium]|nr:polymerase subunit sigma-24 [Verrucomicrobiota bacterium]
MPPSDPEQARWFAEHVQPHVAMLHAWLHRRFEARVDVDDIVQESCVRVLRAREESPPASPKAFLFATARNLALDRLRRHDVSRTDPLGEIDALHVLDEGDGIPETVARHQELALLTEAIQSLPARCRQILTLRKLYGLSHREIAARLGLSESTVSNQILIGIEKCTDYFAEHGDGPGGAR